MVQYSAADICFVLVVYQLKGHTTGEYKTDAVFSKAVKGLDSNRTAAKLKDLCQELFCYKDILIVDLFLNSQFLHFSFNEGKPLFHSMAIKILSLIHITPLTLLPNGSWQP